MKARTKVKASEKPAAPRKSAVARLVQSNEPTIDDEAEDRARGGVQSLGRAFAILEEIARHREGIGLAGFSAVVGLVRDLKDKAPSGESSWLRSCDSSTQPAQASVRSFAFPRSAAYHNIN